MKYIIDESTKLFIANKFIAALENNDVVVNVDDAGVATVIWTNQHINIQN